MANAPLDKIHIRDLLSRCIIGIYPEERNAKQEVIFNITLHAHLRRAAETDCIDDTVDYKAIKKRIFEMAEKSEFQLIETLADRAAQICLEAPGVERVEVSVDKPGALRFARSVAVAIVRERDGSGEAG